MKNYSKYIAPNFSTFLNIVRGLAAFLVLAGHLRGFFFESYHNLNPTSQNIINYILFFITRIGHECVMVFFVLSGYLVGGNYLTDIFNKNANHKKYFIDRFTRMWTVLIPALLIGFLLDHYRCSLLNDCYHVNEWSTSIFMGNVFFLQTIKFEIYTSNKALWSLANEFWYYIIFPLIILPFTFKVNKIIKTAVSLTTIIIFYHLMPNIINLFPIWLMGVVARFITPPAYLKNYKWLVLSYIFLIISIFISNINSNILSNSIVGISFSLLLIIQKEFNKIDFKHVKKPAKLLSDFSFSMYAYHLPIMFLLLVISVKVFGIEIRFINASFWEWLLYLGLLSLLVFSTYILYYITERYTYSIRSWLYKIFQIKNKHRPVIIDVKS